MITLIFKYFWIAFIAVTVANAFILKSRSRNYLAESPELKEGYNKLFKAVLFYGNIPWVIMGFGIITGLADGVFDYLNPSSLNLIVLVFHLSIIIIWGVSIWWVYFKGGAEFLEKHPGFIQLHGFGERRNMTASQIRLFLPLIIAGGVAGMIMMWMIEVPAFPV